MHHPRRRHSRSLQHLLLVVVCSLAPAGTSAADEVPTLEEIATAVREWRQQLLPLRLQFKVTFPRLPYREYSLDTASIRANNSDIHAQWSRREWLLELKDDYHFYRFTYDEYDGERLTRRKVQSGTSDQRFTISHNVSGAEPVPTGAVATPRLNRNVLPTPVAPIYMQFHAGHGEWLDEQLAEGTAQVLGAEELDGFPCVVLLVPHYAEEDARNGAGNKVWFDREHLALIRRVRPVKAGGYVGFEYDCTEFAEVRPGLLFPDQGTFGDFEHDSGYYWQVEAVEVASSLDPALFSPPAGLKASLARQVQRQHQTAAIDLQQPIAPAQAPARFQFWILGLLGALALFVAAILSRRSNVT